MNEKDKADGEFSRIRSNGRRKLSKKEIRKARKHLRIPALHPVLRHIKEFLSLLHSVFFDGYKVSVEIITTIIAAILYLIWIMDVIPDFTPIIGYMDDVAVILTAARLCANELESFRKWKDKND
ncbi:MAG: DUF1232 domain-containing protein [Candidatus Aegiribacteria sp.]|nr:DUF1232 domain-containing protein [Candidatus Aegiribacteria sp.]